MRSPVHQYLFGPVMYDIADAKAVLQNYCEICPVLPREYTIWADLFAAPSLPHIPEKYQGKRVLSVRHCYVGDAKTGRMLFEEMKPAALPIFSFIQEMPYGDAQQFLDETYGHGARNYWTTQCFTALSDRTIEATIKLAHQLPTSESDFLISQLGGAIDDVAPDSTTYPHRGVKLMITPGARWRNGTDDDAAWAGRIRLENG